MPNASLSNSLLPSVCDLLQAVRQRRPLVHHITNYVTMNDSANAVLAVGGLPVMAHEPVEIAEVVSAADVLVLNMGTPTTDRLELMERAAQLATSRQIPVVLDPVGAGFTRFRTGWGRRFIHDSLVTYVRANAGEIRALLDEDSEVRGVEAVEVEGDDPRRLAEQAANAWHCIVIVTGPVDWISDGAQTVGVANGHSILPRITGAGCMVSSLVGVFSGAARSDWDPVLSATAALMIFGIAAEWAAGEVPAPTSSDSSPLWGPGSVRMRLFDALYRLKCDDLRRYARLEG